MTMFALFNCPSFQAYNRLQQVPQSTTVAVYKVSDALLVINQQHQGTDENKINEDIYLKRYGSHLQQSLLSNRNVTSHYIYVAQLSLYTLSQYIANFAKIKFNY